MDSCFDKLYHTRYTEKKVVPDARAMDVTKFLAEVPDYKKRILFLVVVSCPWSISDLYVHPDHNIGQQRCLVRMDVLFWIDVFHIEGYKDGRASLYVVRRELGVVTGLIRCRDIVVYLPRSPTPPLRGGREKQHKTKLRGALQASCCLKRSDCCLPPTPVYFLEDSRRFYELLSPVLLLLSVLQLVSL
ncbi:hypothetical protein LAZ67_9002251 [Cordylochernes scorpioides]|uniref:Uncharacterized protein n=1 Tax=Cordylochernes scorpioides TaxID=51811 RepID=A0ABY6KWF7_9ARAC|nr:hypothetical protein LAZ67_9002251 [Cordylochernes scorpioides]